MLAMRGDLGGEPTWTELLGRVRETALGAYDHQELPFERLVEELATERSLVHTPVFQVIFSVNRAGGRDERLSLGERAAGAVRARGGGDQVRPEPDRDGRGRGARGDARSTGRGCSTRKPPRAWPGTWRPCWRRWSADPGRRLSEVSLLRGPERAHLLHAWNGADTGYTGELCIHELVARAGAAHPRGARAALRGAVPHLRGALSRRACRLAQRLRREGVGPEVRVGICMEPAPEMVVSVLGVLVAGGAYLPLDPELPAERRAYMLADAAPALLLTQAALAERLEGCGVPLLVVDADAEAERIAGESEEAPETGVSPDNLAYVIYTSGSTGRPKGVLVEHRGVGNTFLELGRVYGVGPGERNLAYAPLALRRLAWPTSSCRCATGRELVLARREAMMPGDDLARLLREERITHLKTMPSALAVTPAEDLPDLRTIVTGGEVLPGGAGAALGGGAQLLQRLRGHGGEHPHDLQRLHGRRRGTRRSGGRWRTRSCTCWTPGWSRCRWGCRASCTSAGWGWCGATWRGRT